MANLGSLVVSIVTDTRKFDKGMRASKKRTREFESAVKKAGQIVAGFTTALIAAGTAFAISGFNKAREEIDKIAKTGTKLGIATENLIGLQHAAKLTGVTSETLNMALQRMVRRIAEAAQGTGEAKNALKELGISAKALGALSPDRQFSVLADAMRNVSSQGDRVRLAMKLFDSEGVALVNTLALGSEGLKKMADEVVDLGATFKTEDAERIVQFNDELDKLKTTLGGTIQGITIAVAPEATEAIIAVREIISEIKAFSQFVAALGIDSGRFKGLAKDLLRTGAHLPATGVSISQSPTLLSGIRESVAKFLTFQDAIRGNTENVSRESSEQTQILRDLLTKKPTVVANIN